MLTTGEIQDLTFGCNDLLRDLDGATLAEYFEGPVIVAEGEEFEPVDQKQVTAWMGD